MNNFDLKKYLIENKLTKNSSQSSNDKDEIITDAIQQYSFNVIPKDMFFPLKEFLMDMFEEDSITISDVKQQIDLMVSELGGVEKELKRKGYY